MKKWNDSPKIQELLSRMTLQEKIGQLNQRNICAYDEHVEEIKQEVREGKIGSLLFSGSAIPENGGMEAFDLDFTRELQEAAMESRLKIPLLLGRDVIHGFETIFPIPLMMAASFDDRLIEECYSVLAAEAGNAGVRWAFAPMLDLSRDPRWGRVIEGPGEDPLLGSRYAASAVRGFQGGSPAQEGRLLACAKHFIGYGASEGGRDYHHTEISDYALQNQYLPAFRAAVGAGVGSVMASFNELSGQPVTGSRRLLTEVLREQLGFDGFVVSDWGGVEQLEAQGVAENGADCARLALQAGVDMDMADQCFARHLEAEVMAGRVSMEEIDRAVERVLQAKMRAGLFRQPVRETVNIDRAKHRALARRIAGESMVLLKNDRNLLPLSKKGRVVLTGCMAQNRDSLMGAWTPDGSADSVITIEEGIRAVAPELELFAESCTLLSDMTAVMEQADTVILALGESARASGEFHCLADISLPEDQAALALRARRLGKKVVGLLCFGRPIALGDTISLFDAVLYAGHAGCEAGMAAAELLFGDRNPSGHLSMTLPRSIGQLPLYYNAAPSGRPVNGYYTECRNYIDESGSPLYPFGYGLSYTSFQVEKARLEKETLSLAELSAGEQAVLHVWVSNTGERDGDTVLQLYLRDPAASMARPLRELKAYERRTLSAGETAEFVFRLGLEELGYYLPDGLLTLEKGEIRLFAGFDAWAEECTKLRIV